MLYTAACLLSSQASKRTLKLSLRLYKGFKDNHRTHWFDKQDSELSLIFMFSSLTLSSCRHIQDCHHTHSTVPEHNKWAAQRAPFLWHSRQDTSWSSSWTLWFSLPNREARAYLLIPVTGTVHSVEFPLLETVQGPGPGRCAHISHRHRPEPCPVSPSFLDVLMVKQPAAWRGHLSIVWSSAVSRITRRGNTKCQICSMCTGQDFTHWLTLAI